MKDLSQTELEAILLTVDGRGKAAKREALEALIQRAFNRGCKESLEWIYDFPQPHD